MAHNGVVAAGGRLTDQISIGALAGIGRRDAGVAAGLLNTSQQLGGAIGVAVASTVAATNLHSLAASGHPPAAALTGSIT